MNILVKRNYSNTSIYVVDEEGHHRLCSVLTGKGHDEAEHLLITALCAHLDCEVKIIDRRR